MDAKQSLFSAIGELAYAIAIADGKVNYQETEKLKAMVDDKLKTIYPEYSIAEISYYLSNKSKLSVEEAYEKAMRSLEDGKHYLSADIKLQFIQIIEEIAAAYPPSEFEEQQLISKFKSDLNKMRVNIVLK